MFCRFRANDAHSKLMQEKLEDINGKLDDVESDLFLMESKLPSHPDSNSEDPDTAQKYMEEDRVRQKDEWALSL